MKKNQTPKQPKKKRTRLHEFTHENDIRYLGPLSYQHFQILGWACIVLSQVVLLMRLVGRLDAQTAADSASLVAILSGIAAFSLPFLLIANFSRILNNEGYKPQLIKNIGASAAIAGLFYLFFYRYLVGILHALIDTPEQAMPVMQSLVEAINQKGFLCFNIFIDLLLCTLVMLFLNYKPRRFFRGKSGIIFRLFALLPIGYEVLCMVLKIQAARGTRAIPVWMYPLLPVKPAMTFVLFVVLALFVKTRELRFRRHGKTHEEYKVFLKTRKNSLNFSIFLAVMLVIVSIIDFFVVVGFSVSEGVFNMVQEEVTAITEVTPTTGETGDSLPDAMPTVSETEDACQDTVPIDKTVTADSNAELTQAFKKSFEKEGSEISDKTAEAIVRGMNIAIAVGFGESINLFFLAPLVLLFSYTRKPKNSKIGILIPAVGIVLIVFLYLEGLHSALYHLPFKKLNLQELFSHAEQLAPLFQ